MILMNVFKHIAKVAKVVRHGGVGGQGRARSGHVATELLQALPQVIVKSQQFWILSFKCLLDKSGFYL